MKSSVFIRREKKKSKVPGYIIAQTLRLKETKGDIGIEIEVEGNKFYKENLTKWWNYHKDGSLRGEDNAEYVLKKPIKFDEVPDAVKYLWESFEKYGSVLDNSNRTSVHVHLNAQNWFLNRLTAFIAMYLSVEEILTEWCGDHRVGNLFCLRAKDAPNIVSQVKQFIKTNGETRIPDGMHYAGLNVEALFKFGSIEIRSLRGVTDPQLILDWVAILERMYRLSEDYTDPRTLVDSFSGNGPNAYLQHILGDKTNTVRSAITFSDQAIQQSLYEGIRLAQDICYCVDWDMYDPVKVASDPFNRDIKKVLNHMEAYAGGLEVSVATFNSTATYAPAETYPSIQATAQAMMPPPHPADEPDFTDWSEVEIDAWYEDGTYPEWYHNNTTDDEDLEF